MGWPFKKEDERASSTQNNTQIPDRIEMTESVFKEIMRTIGKYPAETGGILGMRGNKVDEFFFDVAPNRGTRVSYTPNHNAINKILSDKWTPSGTIYMGAVHSHPIGIDRPSYGDEVYAQRLLDHMKSFDKAKPYFYIPIVYSAADTDEFRLYSYIACYRQGRFGIERTMLYIDGYKYEPKAMPIYGRRNTYEQRPQTVSIISHNAPVGRISDSVALKSIEITAKPTKLSYNIGEEFAPSGTVIVAIYSDGTMKKVTTSCSHQGFDSSSPGKKVITVSYTEGGINKTTEFVITVVKNSADVVVEKIINDNPSLSKIEITTPPSKVLYNIGDSFSKNGMVVTATYNNGSAKDITKSCEINGFCSLSAVKKTVTVSYSENGVTKETKLNLQFTFPKSGLINKTVICVCGYNSGNYIKQLADSGINKFVLLSGYTHGIENLRSIEEQIKAINSKTDVFCVEGNITEKTTADEFLELIGDSCKRVLKCSASDVLFVDLRGKISIPKQILELAKYFRAPYVKVDTNHSFGELEVAFKHAEVMGSLINWVVKSESQSNFATDVLNSIKTLICLKMLSGDKQFNESVREYAINNKLQITIPSPMSTPAGAFSSGRVTGSKLNKKI